MDFTNTVIICTSLVAVALIIGYVVVRPYRTKERLAALEKGVNAELFFSGRLLAYIPWPFWASVSILILLLIALGFFRYLNDKETTVSLLELIKYVVGAVIGSMFNGSGKK